MKTDNAFIANVCAASDELVAYTPPAAPAAPAEHAREALEEYGRKMYDAGMDAASDFRDRHRDGLTKEQDAAEMLDAFLAPAPPAPALSDDQNPLVIKLRERVRELKLHAVEQFTEGYNAGAREEAESRSEIVAPALSERDILRAEQSANVMPLIGPLLDAWDGLNNDTKGVLREEGPDLTKYLASINHAMEAAAPNQTPAPAAQGLSDAANMFWNDADPERGHDSIFEVLDAEFGDGVLSIGDTRVIQCAIRLPNITVQVVADPEDEDSFDYEIIAASRTTPKDGAK